MLEKSGWGQDGSKGLGVLGGRVPPPAPPHCALRFANSWSASVVV